MRNELKYFFRNLQKWVDDGCKSHPVFSKRKNLRNALFFWCINSRMPISMQANMAHELDGLLGGNDYDCPAPFNRDEEQSQYELFIMGTLYKNPKRLAFIEEHAK